MSKAMTDLTVGGRYNWKNQPERLVYLGYNWSGNGYWHQFALVDAPEEVWCEVLPTDIDRFEATKHDYNKAMTDKPEVCECGASVGFVSAEKYESAQQRLRELRQERAADKARIAALEQERDEFSMHKMASRQCVGIPASVGVCEPVEGFAERPQDLAPVMREMALMIEADKARIAGLEAALRKIAGEVDGNIRECVRDCVNQRGNVQDIYDYCDNIDTAIDAALAQQGKEGGG